MLVLDVLPEFQRRALEALRQPLEDGVAPHTVYAEIEALASWLGLEAVALR